MGIGCVRVRASVRRKRCGIDGCHVPAHNDGAMDGDLGRADDLPVARCHQVTQAAPSFRPWRMPRQDLAAPSSVSASVAQRRRRPRVERTGNRQSARPLKGPQGIPRLRPHLAVVRASVKPQRIEAHLRRRKRGLILFSPYLARDAKNHTECL